MLRLTTIALLSASLLTSGAQAGMFKVNFVDTHPGTMHPLRVTGTIDVDAITDVVNGSDLTFFHANDPGVPLPNLPTGSGVDYVVDMGTLFFELDASVNQQHSWLSVSETGTVSTTFTVSAGRHMQATPGARLSYDDISSNDRHSVTWTTGSSRLTLGTAVPEPSAFMFLKLVGFVGVGTRWWQKRRNQAS